MEEDIEKGIQSKMDYMERRENEKLEKEASKKLMYKEFLRKQMEDDERRKKLAGSQMTENERKLNTKDIEAYANKDTAMYSKIVGLRNSPIAPHQKYIAQQYGFIQKTSRDYQSHSSALELGGYLAVNPKIDDHKNPNQSLPKKPSIPGIGVNASGQEKQFPSSRDGNMQPYNQ